MVFERFLKRNLNLKILSITLSALLWFVVHLTQNVEGVGRNETSLKVPLVIENLSPDLHILNAPTHVFVMVKGIHKSLEGLKSSDFKASVDFDGKKAGVFRDLPVRVASPVGYVVTGISPSNVEVVVDEEGEKTVPITWESEGERNFTRVTVIPHEVVVKGSKSLLDRVVAAKVAIPINHTTVGELAPIPIDSLARPVPNLALIPESIRVSVELAASNAKVLVVRPAVVGKVADGARLESVSVQPATVLAELGSKDKDLDHLDTLPVDITGKEGTVLVTTKLSVPPTVKLRERNQVTITFDIRQPH